MRLLSGAFGLIVILSGIMLASRTSAPAGSSNVYIAQAAAGSNNGSSCANAYAVSFFNTASNWGASKTIQPGTVVYLCGTITTPLTIYGSGTSGNVIEIAWSTSARISVPYGQIININGNNGYLLFDGGIPCGPPTSCDTVEAANPTGYASGQTGIIEATANGSGLANHNSTTQAFYGCNGCHDIEIRNLIVRNLYIHSSMSDTTGSADTGNFTFQCPEGNSGCAAGTISIHDSTIHDNGNAVSMQRGNTTTMNVYNIDFYRNNWALEYSGDGPRTLNFHDNHCHDASNWDTSSDAYHHNCMHSYMNTNSDSIATNFYNNLSDGNWGSCCTTSTGLYTEIDSPSNFNVFNNVALQYPGNLAPAWEYAATGGVFANNTAIGVATTPGNTYAIGLWATTGVKFENNAVEGYGQYIYVQAGSAFATFDYNQWGAIGLSGNSPWQWMSTGANTFAQWQTACSCDSHGGHPAHLGVNSYGVPQAGSALIGAGVNLTSQGITALDSDTSDGDTRTPVARPASGAWDVGAYAYANPPGPPSNLTAVPQ